MKLLICLLFSPILFLSCKKSSSSNASTGTASYTVSNQSIGNVKELLYPNDILTVFAYPISGSTAKSWTFNFAAANTQPSIIIELIGQFADDDIAKQQPYILSSKVSTGIGFNCSYAASYNSVFSGRDSSFLELHIDKYDKHTVSGTFSFRVYDGFDFAIVTDGKFDDIQVKIY